MRIPFDSLCLRAVCHEAAPALIGGIVQRVAQPSREDLIVTVYRAGTSHTLALSCNPVWARMCLSRMRARALPEPTPFTMVCRKHLSGARLSDIRQVDFDRIVEISLEGPAGSFRLIAEFMGRHSNIVLTDAAGVILDAARRVPAAVNRYRTVGPGVPYKPPPARQGGLDPFHAALPDAVQSEEPDANDVEAAADRLRAAWTGLSPFLARELALRIRRSGLQRAWQEVFGAASEGAWSPVVIRNDAGEPIGAYPIATLQVPAHWQHPRGTFCEALEAYTSAALVREEVEAARRSLEHTVQRAVEALERRIGELDCAIAQEAHAVELERFGNLLLAHPHAVPDASGCVTVPNLYEEETPPIKIPVDVSLTPVENARALFHRSRKMRAAARIARTQLPQLRHQLQSILPIAREVASAATLPDLRRLEGELGAAGLPVRQPAIPVAEDQPERPVHRHIRSIATPEGWIILIGENAEANDVLLRRIAAPNDLWLHARAVASAHAVIRTGGHPENVPHAVIQRAAELVARRSAAKHSSIVPVDYTLRKFVRKPRGSPPGAVVYEREKTLHVAPFEDGTPNP
ncbi:MAG: Rqc2 family fibronectin-binding protein [Chthonomonadales bacterium]